MVGALHLLVLAALVSAANGLHVRLPELQATSRGFVMCAGAPGREKSRYGHHRPSDATLLWSTVRRLRETGNNDPVQVFHVDGELPEDQIKLIESVPDVTVHDLKDALDQEDLDGVKGKVRFYRSYFCKVMALLHSPFDETMMMDSDVLLFRDPAVIWDHTVMKDKGTFFFRDRKVGNGTVRCKAMQKFLDREDVKQTLNPPADFSVKLWTDHKAMCEGDTLHEQDSSLMAVNKRHKNVGPFLSMLKTIMNNYYYGFVTKDKKVPKNFFGWGDKELYWTACDLASVECGWSPRGRPMHVFFSGNFIPWREKLKAKKQVEREKETGFAQLQRLSTDSQEEDHAHGLDMLSGEPSPALNSSQQSPNATKKARSWMSNGPRTCIAQVQVDGDGSRLLLANLDESCDWAFLGVNGAEVWNANNTDPDYWGNAWKGFEIFTGKGRRALSNEELEAFLKFRRDISNQEPDTIKEFGDTKDNHDWIARALENQVSESLKR